MAERRVSVATAEGLHARPAALFVQAAAASGRAVRIRKLATGADADARSILAVLSLDIRHGDEILLWTDDPHADETLDQLVALVTQA